jgi:hypothetical protein
LDAASLHFGRRLMDLIREREAVRREPLLMGQATDFADYKFKAGYLRALADVVGFMDGITMEDDNKGHPAIREPNRW